MFVNNKAQMKATDKGKDKRMSMDDNSVKLNVLSYYPRHTGSMSYYQRPVILPETHTVKWILMHTHTHTKIPLAVSDQISPLRNCYCYPQKATSSQ